MSTHMSTRMPTHMSTRMSTRMSTHMSTRMSTHMSTRSGDRRGRLDQRIASAGLTVLYQTKPDMITYYSCGFFIFFSRFVSSRSCRRYTYGLYSHSMAYVVMAYVVVAYIVIAFIVMASIVMACTIMANIVMAYIVMAYIVMACTRMAYTIMAYTVVAYVGRCMGSAGSRNGHAGGLTVCIIVMRVDYTTSQRIRQRCSRRVVMSAADVRAVASVGAVRYC